MGWKPTARVDPSPAADANNPLQFDLNRFELKGTEPMNPSFKEDAMRNPKDRMFAVAKSVQRHGCLLRLNLLSRIGEQLRISITRMERK